MQEPGVIIVTEELNALDYLESGWKALKRADEDDMAWKWVCIGLHGALYGFAICALRLTDPDRVIEKNGMLITATEAIKRCQKTEWMQKPLVLPEEEHKAIRSLARTFRNFFEHYIPTTWYIGRPTIAWVCLKVLPAIRFLALDGSIFIRLDEAQRTKVAQILDECETLLGNFSPELGAPAVLP